MLRVRSIITFDESVHRLVLQLLAFDVPGATSDVVSKLSSTLTTHHHGHFFLVVHIKRCES